MNFSKKEILFSIASGVMIGTSYIPFPPWALFFCLIPLWSAFLNQTSYKKIFILGWITQFTLSVIGFHWIPYTITEFGHLPTYVGYLGLFAFASLTNLHYPIAGCLWLFIKKRFLKNSLHSSQLNSSFRDILLLSLLTSLLEKWNPQIFPWNLGYTWLYGELPAYHIADIIGFSGLSTITYILNGWILYAAQNIKIKKIFHREIQKIFILFVAINLLGLYQNQQWKKTDSEIQILAVQPNIGNQEKQYEIFGSKFKYNIVSKHLELTEQSLKIQNPNLILWPETSIPEYMDPYFFQNKNVSRILNFLLANKVPLLTGAYSHNLKTFQDSNALFLFDTNANLLSTYKKHQLLAFGEYLPFSELFPSLLKLLPTIANFERGPGPTILSLPINDSSILLGPQICYEGLHPVFSTALSNKGADILINVTNDSWFGHTFESSQHLFMTLARSIEIRRPMIRSTNTGITSAILADGSILGISPQKSEWSGFFNLKYKKNAPQTIFAIFPYIDLLFCIISIMTIIVGIRYDKFKKS